jgi:hypothetical protein
MKSTGKVRIMNFDTEISPRYFGLQYTQTFDVPLGALVVHAAWHSAYPLRPGKVKVPRKYRRLRAERRN